MKVLNDFQCPSCGLRQEYFVDNQESTVECLDCGSLATKAQSPIRFKLEGVTGAYPTAYDKWSKTRAQKMAEERKDSAYEPPR